MTSLKQFFVHIMWIVGEHASSLNDPRCTHDLIYSYHEVLEAFAYEVSIQMRSKLTDTENTTYKVKGRSYE